MRRRSVAVVAYALVVGAVAGILLASTVGPVGLGGGMDAGAPLYLAGIVAVSIIVVDTVLRVLLDRWPAAATVIPLVASAAGIVAGWWAAGNTMGGPT